MEKGGEKVKKKTIRVSIMSLALVSIIITASLTLLLVNASQNDDAVVKVETVGDVILQLPPAPNATPPAPPGTPSHPTFLSINVGEITQSTFGPSRDIGISLWSTINQAFVPVAYIYVNPSPDQLAYERSRWNGTSVYIKAANGVVTRDNIFVVSEEDLQVTREGDVLTANLSKPINITLAASLGGNFTFPPMAFEFRGFDAAFSESFTAILPSRWTIITETLEKPAWVRVWIPQWFRVGYYTNVGTLNMHLTRTSIPPSST